MHLADFKPDTDFVKIRDRIVGIILGIIVSTLVFKYLWPERATDQLRERLASTIRNLSRLITSPRPQESFAMTNQEAASLRGEINKNIDDTLRLSELAAFEAEEDGPPGLITVYSMKSLISTTQSLFLTASLLSSESCMSEWERSHGPVRQAESELRNAVAAELDRTAAALMDGKRLGGINLDRPLQLWNTAAAELPAEIAGPHRSELLRRLVTQMAQLA